MSEIEPTAELASLVAACQPGGTYSGYPSGAYLYDVLEQRGLVSSHESDLGPMATITPAGKVRLRKLIDQRIRSVPNV